MYGLSFPFRMIVINMSQMPRFFPSYLTLKQNFLDLICVKIHFVLVYVCVYNALSHWPIVSVVVITPLSLLSSSNLPSKRQWPNNNNDDDDDDTKFVFQSCWCCCMCRHACLVWFSLHFHFFFVLFVYETHWKDCKSINHFCRTR